MEMPSLKRKQLNCKQVALWLEKEKRGTLCLAFHDASVNKVVRKVRKKVSPFLLIHIRIANSLLDDKKGINMIFPFDDILRQLDTIVRKYYSPLPNLSVFLI